MNWVMLKKYCELTGEPQKSVLKRRERGEWLDDKHTRVRNRRIWVNLEAAERWVETGQ